MYYDGDIAKSGRTSCGPGENDRKEARRVSGRRQWQSWL